MIKNPIKLLGMSFDTVKSEMDISIVEARDDDEDKLEDRKFTVTSPDGSWEMILDENNRIETIFLNLYNGHPGVLDVSNKMDKDDILLLFGEPHERGLPIVDDILGEYGAWEKYRIDNYYLHIEHEKGEKGVKMITLMNIC